MVNKTLNAVGTTLVLTGVVFMGTSKFLESTKSSIRISRLDKAVTKLEKELAEYE